MRSAYAEEIAYHAVHRFTRPTERDDWVGDDPENRRAIGRTLFLHYSKKSGYFYDHDSGEYDGYPVEV